MKKWIKFEYIRLALYIISFVLVGLVFTGKLETSCYYKDNYGLFCPACGLTRATLNIVKLNFVEAFKYNAFYTAVLVPLAGITAINDIYIIIKRKITHKNELSLVEIAFGDAKNEHS